MQARWLGLCALSIAHRKPGSGAVWQCGENELAPHHAWPTRVVDEEANVSRVLVNLSPKNRRWYSASVSLLGKIRVTGPNSWSPEMPILVSSQMQNSPMSQRVLISGHMLTGIFNTLYNLGAPITVASRSKARTVFARLNSGIVVSNHTQGMVVCVSLFCVCAVVYVGSDLVTGWSPVQGDLSIVYRIKKLKKRSRHNKWL
jgi:hypothetical protein